MKKIRYIKGGHNGFKVGDRIRVSPNAAIKWPIKHFTSEYGIIERLSETGSKCYFCKDPKGTYANVSNEKNGGGVWLCMLEKTK